jgi:hypothetical protein
MELDHTAHRLAAQHVVSDIECNCVACKMPGSDSCWYDTRPMLDEREHAPQSIDMAREALAYAEARELIERHPEQPHLVRLTAKGMDC